MIRMTLALLLVLAGFMPPAYAIQESQNLIDEMTGQTAYNFAEHSAVTRCQSPSTDSQSFCLDGRPLLLLQQTGNLAFYLGSTSDQQTAFVLSSGECGSQPCLFQVFVGARQIFYGVRDSAVDQNALIYYPETNRVATWLNSYTLNQNSRIDYRYKRSEEGTYLAKALLNGHEDRQQRRVQTMKTRQFGFGIGGVSVPIRGPVLPEPKVPELPEPPGPTPVCPGCGDNGTYNPVFWRAYLGQYIY